MNLNWKDRAYVLNRDGFKSIGNYWISLYVTGNIGSTSYDLNYFDCFGVEHIPRESRKFIGNKNIMTNI